MPSDSSHKNSGIVALGEDGRVVLGEAQLFEREHALAMLRIAFERGSERGAAVIVDGP